MATYYSDIFGTQPDLTNTRGAYKSTAANNRQVRKITRITIGTGAADGDVWVMQPVHYLERLVALTGTCTSSFNSATTYTADVGLYMLNGPHSTLGTVLDLDLFSSAKVIKASALTDFDFFTESTSMATELYRGKTFWDLADTTLTMQNEWKLHQWAICVHVNITGAVSAGGELVLTSTILPRA